MAVGLGDESIFAECPHFEAAEANAVAGAARARVGADECPMVYGAIVPQADAVHKQLHIWKSAHEALRHLGDGAAPDGSDGKSSTIVEYRPNGDIVTTYTVPGHNDGLRVNPKTKRLWAMQNEDGNPNLVIIDPIMGTQTIYTFGPTPHGGRLCRHTLRRAE